MENIKILHFLLALLISSFGYAQKHFNASIYINEDIDLKKIEIHVDNGKTEYYSREKINGNKFNIKGPYYGEYAQITIRYPKEVSSNFLEQSTFFIKDKIAEIKLNRADSAAAILDHYFLVNAIDFKEEKEKMSKYDFKEKQEIDAFIQKHGSAIFNDTILTEKLFKLEKPIYDKDLEYILDNMDSYYAFSFFRRNFVKPGRISSDSILSILNNFPDRFKNSHEGNFIRELVNGRLVVKKDGLAPDFRTQDILGKTISLDDYKNKEYVLLNFWATWCGPCIEEMPVLKNINDEYSKKGLTFISIAYPSTYEAFEKDIKKHQMEWINIYNGLDLINSYGGNQAIPRVYLIDKTGKIIYDRKEAVDDTRLIKLNEVLSGIFKN
jgi:thiol-disulfide isomerase/thioredoxin